jgi:hypothetical protein
MWTCACNKQQGWGTHQIRPGYAERRAHPKGLSFLHSWGNTCGVKQQAVKVQHPVLKPPTCRQAVREGDA